MKKGFCRKTLALLIVLSMVGATSGTLADGPGDNVTAENETITVDRDLHGFACAIATDGKEASLTVNGDVTDDLIPGGAAVCANASGGGSATIQTGDVKKDNSDGYQDEAGVDAFAYGEESRAVATVGNIVSDNQGVYIYNEGGSVAVTTGDITATDGNGIDIESYGGTAEVTSGAINALDIGVKAMIFEGEEEHGSTTAPVTVQVSGDITAKNPENDHQAAGVEIYNDAASVKAEVTVDGNITVAGGKVDDESTDVGSLGMGVWAEAGSSTATIHGDITVSGTDNPMGISVSSGADSESAAVVAGNVTVTNDDDANASGIRVYSFNSGDAAATVTGNVEVNGGESSVGVTADAWGGEAKARVTITGDIRVEGENAADVCASASPDCVAEISVEGNLTVTDTDADAVRINNGGGEIDIDVTGNLSSGHDGIVTADNDYVNSYRRDFGEKYEGTVVPDENELYTTMDGSAKVYRHVEGDTVVYYMVDDDEVYAWTKSNDEENAGNTSIKIVGDVTAEETGAKIAIENDASRLDLIVDGTLSGESQSVLLSTDTINDDLKITVWEIKSNTAGNLVERVVKYDDQGKPVTEADKDLEKKIQYIIRIEPTQKDYITTQGTTAYEGYNVANEGQTVTLKLNIPAGQRVVNAFNGTDTKVKLLVDAKGDYYLEVPRGGGVMLSLELEAIPDPSPNITAKAETKAITETTKVAVMAAATDTAETTALKAQIDEVVKNGDILSILSDDIKAQLPEGISKLVEAITLTLENYDSGMGAVTVKVQPTNRKYAKGEKATVVIALPDGKGGYIWFLIEGEGQEDGTLAINLPANIAAQLAGKTFVTMILE